MNDRHLAPDQPSQLEVLAKDLVSALRMLSAAKNRHNSVSISFDGQNLRVSRGPSRVGCPATGMWAGTARVDRGLMKLLLNRSAGLSETIVIAARPSEIRIDKLTIPCSWE